MPLVFLAKSSTSCWLNNHDTLVAFLMNLFRYVDEAQDNLLIDALRSCLLSWSSWNHWRFPSFKIVGQKPRWPVLGRGYGPNHLCRQLFQVQWLEGFLISLRSMIFVLPYSYAEIVLATSGQWGFNNRTTSYIPSSSQLSLPRRHCAMCTLCYWTHHQLLALRYWCLISGTRCCWWLKASFLFWLG